MKEAKQGLFGFIALAVVFIIWSSAYTVHETEQIIITQFGKPVGEPIKDAGLHFKTPFVQEVNRIEKRIVGWDGDSAEMPTKDKTYIEADTFARWRISDPTQYFLRLRDERSAKSRLDDILGSETRNAIATHDLIEVIRTTKDRIPEQDESLAEGSPNLGKLNPIDHGRSIIEAKIYENAVGKLQDFGIELLDVRFKRINYTESVRERIYGRMISERQQIAARFLSEGEGEAAKIIGKKEKDLQEIESEAYKTTLTVRGEADAEAIEIYAEAYNQGKEAEEFYQFLKTMETYQEVMGSDTTLILSTDSDLFKFMKRISPDAAK